MVIIERAAILVALWSFPSCTIVVFEKTACHPSNAFSPRENVPVGAEEVGAVVGLAVGLAVGLTVGATEKPQTNQQLVVLRGGNL